MGITISNNDNTIDITTNTDSLIIANNVSGETIAVDAEKTSVVTVATPGPKGDPYLYGDDDDVLFGNITGSNISASGYVSASQFVGNLTGNAATSTTSTLAATATNALNLYVGNDETGDTNNPILFSNSGGNGYKPIFEDSALYFDNTNNHLNVGGNVYSANTYTIGMSGKFTPQNENTIGPSLEGKFGVEWALSYGNEANFPNPTGGGTPSNTPSALAAAGWTIPYKCTVKKIDIVCSGTSWKDIYNMAVIYFPPRTEATPLSNAVEETPYISRTLHIYSTPNTVSTTYGISPPSLAEVTGEYSEAQFAEGGFFTPILISATSVNPVYVDVQITIQRIQ